MRLANQNLDVPVIAIYRTAKPQLSRRWRNERSSSEPSGTAVRLNKRVPIKVYHAKTNRKYLVAKLNLLSLVVDVKLS